MMRKRIVFVPLLWALSVLAAAQLPDPTQITTLGVHQNASTVTVRAQAANAVFIGANVTPFNIQMNVLQSPGQTTQTWWNNVNGGVVQVLQTVSNPQVSGATIQTWDSDFDPITVGTISVTHNSAAFSLACNNANDDAFDGCTALSSLTGLLVTNGASVLWEELNGALSCVGLNCTGNFTTNYTGTTNAGASFNGYNFTWTDSLGASWTNALKIVDWAGPQWVSFTAAANCRTASGNSSNYAGSASVASNCAAPAKLWNILVNGTSYVQCTSGGNAVFTPNWLSTTFQPYFKAAATALVSHYALNQSVQYVRIALGHGGETLPSNVWNSDPTCKTFWANQLNGGVFDTVAETNAWNSLWISPMLTWAQGMSAAVKTQLGLVPKLMVGPTPMGIPNTQLPNLIAPEAVAAGIGFGTQGLEASDITGYPACTANWCNLFASYTGVVAPLELQTLNQSCPSLAGTGITCAGQQASTGPLPSLLFFSAPNFPTAYELYYQDWLLAYGTNNNYCKAANGANYTSGQCAIIQPQYLAAFKFVRPCVFPFLCAPTNFTTLTYPSSPPNIGGITGAGNTFTDPVFGTTGVRLTDGAFDPSLAGNSSNSFSVSNGGSADDNWFNTNDTLALVGAQGGRKYLVGFNPNTLALFRPYAANVSGCPLNGGNCSLTGGWSSGDSLEFSLVNPYKIYDLNGTTLQSYTFDGPAYAVPPAPVTVVNYLENSPPGCVTTGCNGLPADFGTPTWNDDATPVTGDAVFGAGFSSTAYHFGAGTGQNSGIYATVYVPGKGVMSYNTQTGAIQADIGFAGGLGLTCGGSQCTGTSTAPGTFSLHNLKLNKAGTILFLAWGSCISGTCTNNVPFAWVIGTTTVYISETVPGFSSGHWAAGTKGLINDPGHAPLYGYYYRLTPLNGPAGSVSTVNQTPVPACLTSTDGHQSWQANNFSDTNPFAFSRYSGAYANSGLFPLDQPVCAWINEIDLADMDGSALVHREALTFNTGYSIFFNAGQAFSCSSSGNFCAMGSDWFNTMRNAAGTSTSCIPNGPTWKANTTQPATYVINPAVGFNPGNFSYQIPGSCTTGGVQPATWNQTPGGTQADGGCTWTNIGAPTGVNACGIDVIMWKMR